MRRLLLAALLSLAVPSVAEAKPFVVGTGQHGGIAIDDAGTIYVGWQINVYGPGDAVQFCVVPPKATACGSQVTIPFPAMFAGTMEALLEHIERTEGSAAALVNRLVGEG